MANDNVYHVLKYGDKYYSPYLISIYDEISSDINLILTDKKHLAAKFGNKKHAEECLEMDCSNRFDVDFDRSKARVVKIIRKAK